MSASIQVLSDKKINQAMCRMIDESTKHLILITPYFDPPQKLKEKIVRAAASRNVQITLVIRDIRQEEKSDLQEATRTAIELMRSNNVKVKWLEWLHA